MRGGARIGFFLSEFFLVAAVSAIVFLSCKKENSVRSANPGDEIVFGSSIGNDFGSGSSETKGGSDADETFFFEWKDFDEGKFLGSLSGSEDIGDFCNATDSDINTKTEYSGKKYDVGSKKYERIDWVDGDKVKIYGHNVMTSDGAPSQMVYKVASHSVSLGNQTRSSAILEKESSGTKGIRWGSGNADFYSVYPGASPSKVDPSNWPSSFDVTVKLPKEQPFSKEELNTSNPNYKYVICHPDMEYAAMMGVSRNVPRASSVNLSLYPLVTTFKVKISANSNSDKTVYAIKRISLVSSSVVGGTYNVSYDKTSGNSISSFADIPSPSVSTSISEVAADFGSKPVLIARTNEYGNSGNPINYLEVTLFTVPVLHDDMVLRVTFSDNTTRNLELKDRDFKPIEFKPYRKYDLNIGIYNQSRYILNIKETHPAKYTGTGMKLVVESLREYTTYSHPYYYWKDFAPWHEVGYSQTENGVYSMSNKPSWIPFEINDKGAVKGSGIYTFSANLPVIPAVMTPNAQTASLRSKSEVGTKEDPIDLSKLPLPSTPPFYAIGDGAKGSTYDSNPMNTANCYVVTRPGWYKIPAVYGNAIKDGLDNTRAYCKYYTSSGNRLSPLIRHDGRPITHPWIKDNTGIDLTGDATAFLQWQDWPGLVEDIEFQTDRKYIVFHISKENIHEGNAVISLEKSKYINSDILWSWHIWVCAKDLSAIPVRNNKAKSLGRPGLDTFNFLSENLGACQAGEDVSFPPREIWLKIANRKLTAKIKIKQEGGHLNSTGYNDTFYQWGRKDPLLASNGMDNKRKTWFTWNGEVMNTGIDGLANIYPETVDGAKEFIKIAIGSPRYFINHFKYTYYYNLWDSFNTYNDNFGTVNSAKYEAVAKSVYDPCPPGFCIPPNGAFTGFTKTGNNSNTTTEFNVEGGFNKGRKFYTVPYGQPGDNTILFHASGYSTYSLYQVFMHGCYWSSVPKDPKFARHLDLCLDWVHPIEKSERYLGLNVRAVQEN